MLSDGAITIGIDGHRLTIAEGRILLQEIFYVPHLNAQGVLEDREVLETVLDIPQVHDVELTAKEQKFLSLAKECQDVFKKASKTL